MTWETWLLATGVLLVLECLMPMAAPTRWRRFLEQMLQLQDGQIRFWGVLLVMTGLALIWWAD